MRILSLKGVLKLIRFHHIAAPVKNNKLRIKFDRPGVFTNN